MRFLVSGGSSKNVLLPFLRHSQGCTLDFFSDVLFWEDGNGKVIHEDTFSLIINCADLNGLRLPLTGANMTRKETQVPTCSR